MEEQEEDKVDPDYLKGFNEGYMLAQHNPELAQKLASIESDLSRVAGFKAGHEQLLAEQIHSQEKEVNNDPQQPQAKEASAQLDVFDELYRQHTQTKDSNPKLLSDIAQPEKAEERADIFEQLKKKQEQTEKGLDIEP